MVEVVSLEEDFLAALLVAARVTPAMRPEPLLFPDEVVVVVVVEDDDDDDGAQQYGLSAALPISELSSRLSWMGSSVSTKRH